MSFNINGSISKCEHSDIIELFLNYDIIALLETKTDCDLFLPGFMSLKSSTVTGEETRGGVCVLFKNDIYQRLDKVDCKKDQVWFTLKHAPNYIFGAVYVAPKDSPYFDQGAFAHIQEQVLSHNRHAIVMGDINARIPDLSTFDEPVLGVNYRPNPDNGSNSHGHELVSICKNMDLLPLNCLDIGELHFDGGLTYRQGPQWKSQIDWILCSKSCLGHINSFDILNGTQFPSNHAPVTVTLTCSLSSTSILERARLINEESPIRSSTKKTMRFHQIDVNKLLAGLPSPETLFPYDEQSAASLCETITNTLLASCLTAKKQKSGRPLTSPRNALERWANLLEIKDSKVIWQAINWKGNYKPPINRHDTPSDEDFAKHFHELLNPPDKCQLTAPQTDTYVPVLDDPITPFEVDTALKRLQVSKSEMESLQVF
jgi:exonuclease III